MTGGESNEGSADGTAGLARDVHMSEDVSSSSSEDSSDCTSDTIVDRKRRRSRGSETSCDAAMLYRRRESGMAAQKAQRPSQQWEELIGLTWHEKYSLHEKKMR
jgi:hypothetical protein